MKTITEAFWHIELNCLCPHCGEHVDLLEHADFWHDHTGTLDVCEHGTARSMNLGVTCPECNKDFTVDCLY